MWNWSAYLALAVCLGASLEAKAYEFDEDEATESSSWTEIKEPRKGATCLDLCLADGEDLFDCEYYCIQTVKTEPTFLRPIARNCTP